MIEKLTKFTDYFRKVPAAFLVAIISVLCLILFLADDIAETLAVDEFRSSYRKYLDPAFLLTVAFSIARIFIFFKDIYNRKKSLKIKQSYLYSLTPKEKGYLIPYIKERKTQSMLEWMTES